MNKSLQKILEISDKIHPVFIEQNGQTLQYFRELGIGYLPAATEDNILYDKDYYESYKIKAATNMGRALTVTRSFYTYQCTDGNHNICDIGVGSGDFVREYDCFGYDINPFAVKDLQKEGKFIDPYFDESIDYLTFWDSLEHINDPSEILSRPTCGVILSMPIYKSFEDTINSKHFKPNEHIWYFTDAGLKTFMRAHGYEHRTFTNIETLLGRESINSYYFEKI
ncbi:hypothetical protein [Synechococcus phage BUCT-ZZ01]|nr:hypothetical protein [Synechococcus phage BUCT-ZZ01]